MFTPEEITNEVRAVFGDDVRVEVKFSANIDAYFIEVSKRVNNEILMVSAHISALEELQAKDPLEFLRSYIKYMHMYMLEAMNQEREVHGDMYHERLKIGKNKSKDNGPTYH